MEGAKFNANPEKYSLTHMIQKISIGAWSILNLKTRFRPFSDGWTK